MHVATWEARETVCDPVNVWKIGASSFIQSGCVVTALKWKPLYYEMYCVLIIVIQNNNSHNTYQQGLLVFSFVTRTSRGILISNWRDKLERLCKVIINWAAVSCIVSTFGWSPFWGRYTIFSKQSALWLQNCFMWCILLPRKVTHLRHCNISSRS